MHDSCKAHMKNQWHITSTKSAKSFTQNVPVNIMLMSGHQSEIIENRKIISKIISTIIFCGTHDLPLRGKQLNTGKYF